MIEPNTSEAGHDRDSNPEVLGVGDLFDYPSGSEQRAVESPLFEEFQDDDHEFGAGRASQPDLKDEYRERLTKLSSALLKQLNHISSGQTDEIF